MADLELAETAKTAPSPLTTPPRLGLFHLGGLRPKFPNTHFVTSTKAIHSHPYLGVAVAYGPKPIVRLSEGPILPDAHTASLCAWRDRLAEAYSASLRALADQLPKALSGSGVHDGDLLKDLKIVGIVPYASRKDHVLVNPLVSSTAIFPAKLLASTMAIGRPKTFVPLRGAPFLPAAYSASLWSPFLPNTHSASPLPGFLLAAILFSQGESSGSGGRAREGRNGGGGNGNQGIGGGGGQIEGIGNERRGNRGRNHGGGDGSGDDDGNGLGAWVDFIEGNYSLARILLFLIAEMFGTLMSFDIHGLPARARIFRVVSLGFNLAAIVCLWASIRRRRTNPILARILSWIASFATLLGFISMIFMAFSASFSP